MTTSDGGRGLLASLVRPPDACTPSSLPAWLRFAIAFGVLYTLKYALPFLGISLIPQVVILLVVATFIAFLVRSMHRAQIVPPTESPETPTIGMVSASEAPGGTPG